MKQKTRRWFSRKRLRQIEEAVVAQKDRVREEAEYLREVIRRSAVAADRQREAMEREEYHA